MKHLIIGAGATRAEALSLGNSAEQSPPLMDDFAQKMWSNYTPHPVLEAYLNQLGHTELGNDPRELFYRLEREGHTNIEKFMEFAWVNSDNKFEIDSDQIPPSFISGVRISAPGNPENTALGIHGEFWGNLLYHGIGSPLSLLMFHCFFENGKGWKNLDQSQSIASILTPTDLVLNLNYDTVFEIALQQLRVSVCYCPNNPKVDEVLVAKPHGSLNMVMNNTGFTFGQPDWLGMPQPSGYCSYSGIIPPRLNKEYSQNPVAKMILKPLKKRKPKNIIMWGVGLTESDVDLVGLYKKWGKTAKTIDVINPSEEVAIKVKKLFHSKVRHFPLLNDWVNSQ